MPASMDRRIWKRLWTRASLAGFLFRFVPFVRMVGLNGSLATGRGGATSDVDLFIVIKRGHIFSGRLVLMAMVTLLGLKPHGEHQAGKLCLNRFASDRFLEITPHDRYHAEVFHNLIPMMSVCGTYPRYVAINAWMETFGFPVQKHMPVWFETPFSWMFRSLGEIILWPVATPIEGMARRWMERRAAPDPRRNRPGSVLVLSEHELRFHLAKLS